MKVKELKAILANAKDEQNVVIDDVNDMCIAIVGGGESSMEGIRLHTQQEFPAEWFDGDGEEIDWALNGIVLVTRPENDDMYINYAEETGGREVYVKATFYDGYAEGVGFKLTYPKMSELTADLFHRIDQCCGGRCTDSGCITPQDVCIYCGKLVHFGIMDTTNGHNKDLVRDINIRWVEDHEMFRPILLALYERDAEEIYKCEAFEWGDGVEEVKGYMEQYWSLHAPTYLKYVADDQDLKTILTFVRYDRSEH